MGMPVEIQTDRGTHFVAVFETLIQGLRIDTLDFYCIIDPQSQSVMKRYKSTLDNMLCCYFIENLTN